LSYGEIRAGADPLEFLLAGRASAIIVAVAVPVTGAGRKGKFT
jgi:hypothetical protein